MKSQKWITRKIFLKKCTYSDNKKNLWINHKFGLQRLETMTTPASHSLSAEEEAELARSNKKVKEMHHPSFFARGSTSGEKSFLPLKFSFKDKLVGEIPGAFVQAFNFSN